MVDQKITDLTALGIALVSTDLVESTIDPSGTPLTRKVPLSAMTTFFKKNVAQEGPLSIEIDGQGSVITTGSYGTMRIPYNCTINSNDLVADQSGSIVIDVWVDTYANFPPTDADSITASAPPTLTSAIKSQDATLTGWTTSLSEGDYLYVNVDSVTTITKATLTLVATRT